MTVINEEDQSKKTEDNIHLNINLSKLSMSEMINEEDKTMSN